MTIKHAFTSPKADGSDATLVRPSNWNADHQVDADGVDTTTAIPLVIGGANASEVVVGRDGIATTHGIVWDDVTGPALQASGNASLTQEAYRDTPAILLFMRHDQDDSLTFAFQMPHRWKRDTEVKVHAHYIPMVTPATDQNVRLLCRYAWAHSSTELPAVASWGTATVDIPVPASGADTFKEKLFALFSTTPTGSKESSILLVTVTRQGTSASDSYTTGKATGTQTANFCLLTVDAHFQTDKSGTVSELPS
jgi:hypothetical protein